MQRALRLIVEYRGSNFSGWQKQPGQRTVQAEMQKAISTVLRTEDVSLLSAGRTDAGVHAKRQVVRVKADVDELDLHRLQVGVSSILKNEVSILKIEEVSLDFHPIKDAIRKQYSYQIHNAAIPPVHLYGYVMHVVKPLDLERMKSEMERFIGEHDFSSFRGTDCSAKSPIRKVESVLLKKEEPLVTLEFIGNGFLKQMVRNMVGTLIHFGLGKMCETSVDQILAEKNRAAAGPTAEPWGLFLDWVEYEEGRL